MTEVEKKVLWLAERKKDRLYQLLQKLVSYDSQNFASHGREKECAAYIEKEYRALGLETALYSPDSVEGIKQHEAYLSGRGLEDRPNVTGVLRSKNGAGSVMLMAHIDTMPVGERSKWKHDPFGGEIEGGKLYGLGSGDNKFGIATGIFVIEVLRELGIELGFDVALTAYADEEYGGGVGALAAVLKYPCDFYINFDGANCELWVAALGGCVYRFRVDTKKPVDTAGNCVDALYLVKAELEKLGGRRRAELHANPLYTGSDMERSAYRLMQFTVGESGTKLDFGELKTTIYACCPRAQLEKELRDIERKLAPDFERLGVKTEGFLEDSRFFGYYETKKDSRGVDVLEEAAAEVFGSRPRRCGACLSDLSVILPYGGPESLNYGIMRDFSEEGGAHQPDERVDLKEFIDHAKSVLLFLLRYCGTKNQEEQNK